MSYQDHATRQQSEAEKAHALWISTLTPEQLRQAIDYGVTDPPKDSHKVGGHSPDQKKDIADTSIARTEIDIASQIDDIPSTLADRFSIPLPTAEKVYAWHESEITEAREFRLAHTIQIIVAGILSANNPKLAAAGIAFATRLDALNGLNQSDFARENNIRRQTVSKCTKHWQRALGIRPSVHQKSEKACISYQKTATANHWRSQRCTAEKARKILSNND